ncbi:MAG: ATP-dependent DNA helicase [Burkholderiaceae bacterium]|nr:ATP-dependent DNA helicase [Burkholderiaceae bacterium]
MSDDGKAGGSDALARARDAVRRAFGAGGALAGAVPGFVARPAQTDFALAVFDTIVERGTLVAEAGTGTGKTFAYLVPALLAGGKVLVAAGTKALQDQIFTKDLALLRALLAPELKVALLKGRQNYVCLARLARAEAEGRLTTREEVAHLRAIGRFARASATGDRAELDSVPEEAPVWHAVTSTRDNCLGAQCAHFDACFVYRARRSAQAADVVVVNHHLVLADLALRDDAIGDFLPAADTVILDEAHQLPALAADFFGTGFSLAQTQDLAADARALGIAKARDGAPWVDLTRAVEQAARQVRLALAEAGLQAGGRVALARLSARTALAAALGALAEAVAALKRALEANRGRDAELDALVPRAEGLGASIAEWIDAIADPAGPQPHPAADDSVRWIGASAQGASFNATPLAAGPLLARLRAQRAQAWIFTSATLTVAGRFDRFLADIGMPQATTRRWESPFDYARQGLLYLPQRMPSPQAQDFAERVAECAWPVIAASGGRAFVLCTTLRAVQRVAARLRERAHRAGLPLLVQGAAPRRQLLEQFRAAGNAILIGSVSFWEGIDVRGEALSLVVIDKLPFAPPDDPVVEARIARLRALGRNPFLEYQLPQAVTLLRQGVGRLIRDERDRGVLMILDERLLTKSYGRTVLASLPPFQRTRSEAQACAFLRGQACGQCRGERRGLSAP